MTKITVVAGTREEKGTSKPNKYNGRRGSGARNKRTTIGN